MTNEAAAPVAAVEESHIHVSKGKLLTDRGSSIASAVAWDNSGDGQHSRAINTQNNYANSAITNESDSKTGSYLDISANKSIESRVNSNDNSGEDTLVNQLTPDKDDDDDDDDELRVEQKQHDDITRISTAIAVADADGCIEDVLDDTDAYTHDSFELLDTSTGMPVDEMDHMGTIGQRQGQGQGQADHKNFGDIAGDEAMQQEHVVSQRQQDAKEMGVATLNFGPSSSAEKLADIIKLNLNSYQGETGKRNDGRHAEDTNIGTIFSKDHSIHHTGSDIPATSSLVLNGAYSDSESSSSGCERLQNSENAESTSDAADGVGELLPAADRPSTNTNDAATSTPYKPKYSEEVTTCSGRQTSGGGGSSLNILTAAAIITPNRILLPPDKHHTRPLSPTTSKIDSDFAKKLLFQEQQQYDDDDEDEVTDALRNSPQEQQKRLYRDDDDDDENNDLYDEYYGKGHKNENGDESEGRLMGYANNSDAQNSSIVSDASSVDELAKRVEIVSPFAVRVRGPVVVPTATDNTNAIGSKSSLPTTATSNGTGRRKDSTNLLDTTADRASSSSSTSLALPTCLFASWFHSLSVTFLPAAPALGVSPWSHSTSSMI